jgi:hypothetical protein
MVGDAEMKKIARPDPCCHVKTVFPTQIGQFHSFFESPRKK